MLLVDNDDILPEVPDEAETVLVTTLGSAVAQIDDRILRFSQPMFLKVARVVHDALADGGFDPWDDGVVDLHVRRVIALIALGRLDVAGDPRRPRFSEVKLPGTPGA